MIGICYDVYMRTTLMLDDDIADSVRALAARLRCPMRDVINNALRAGLDQVGKQGMAKPYKTTPRPLGLRAGLSYDNIQELLEQIEGPGTP